MAPSPHTYRRIAEQIQARPPIAHTPWSPPPLSELVARIDAVLVARRAA